MKTDTLEGLKAYYVNSYANGFVNKGDIGYLTYEHDTGIQVDFSDSQLVDFINEVNEEIDEHATERKSNKKWWG